MTTGDTGTRQESTASVAEVLAARPPVSELAFEQAQAELEQVVARLEDRATGLEDALALWERGEALHRHCSQRLASAEERIERLRLDPDAVAAVEAESVAGDELAADSAKGAAGAGSVPPSSPGEAGTSGTSDERDVPPSMF